MIRGMTTKQSNMWGIAIYTANVLCGVLVHAYT
nr:MAG TPA: hypothetical protein [Caudoviricetes sp.]